MKDEDDIDSVKRRDFLRLASTGAIVTALGTATGATPATAETAKPTPPTGSPNIIWIIDDQHSAGLTKRSGYKFDTMPTLDRLAADGVDFRRAYCTAPLCTPSRTSMVTGRWACAHRVRNNYLTNNVVYEKDVFDVAAAQGYMTGLVGKNHTYVTLKKVDFWREYSHVDGDKTNGDRGQNERYEQWLKKLHFNVADEVTPFPVETQFPYRIVSDAIEFIDKAGSRPFFLEVSIPEPHDPEQVPAPYWDMFPPDQIPERDADLSTLKKLGYRAEWLHELEMFGFPETEKLWRRYVSNYLGALRMIDDQIKRLVDHLTAKNLMQNTIIVLVADHGDYLMKYGLARKGVGMSESLARVPMIWHGPGIKADKSVGDTAFVSGADLMPTFCEIMGAPIPHGVQGRSLLPLLQGKDYPKEEFRSIFCEAGTGGLFYEREDRIPPTIAGSKDGGWDELNMVTQSGYQKMVRMDKWKLIYDMMGYGQIYDLEKDPNELNNLFNRPEYAKEQSALLAELLAWTIRTEDNLPIGPQFKKYQVKWPKEHNWYAPHRHGTVGSAFVP
jgi:arylsulfatase A-like enzyme